MWLRQWCKLPNNFQLIKTSWHAETFLTDWLRCVRVNEAPESLGGARGRLKALWLMFGEACFQLNVPENKYCQWIFYWHFCGSADVHSQHFLIMLRIRINHVELISVSARLSFVHLMFLFLREVHRKTSILTQMQFCKCARQKLNSTMAQSNKITSVWMQRASNFTAHSALSINVLLPQRVNSLYRGGRAGPTPWPQPVWWELVFPASRVAALPAESTPSTEKMEAEDEKWKM